MNTRVNTTDTGRYSEKSENQLANLFLSELTSGKTVQIGAPTGEVNVFPGIGSAPEDPTQALKNVANTRTEADFQKIERFAQAMEGIAQTFAGRENVSQAEILQYLQQSQGLSSEEALQLLRDITTVRNAVQPLTRSFHRPGRVAGCARPGGPRGNHRRWRQDHLCGAFGV
ncbi:MAG: hypothetical protein HC850_01870 [Rhodomicrobium sp.]|nr:hypothetical protein [Rhodomicrobium sp.]